MIHTYIYTHTHTHTSTYMYIYLNKERDGMSFLLKEMGEYLSSDTVLPVNKGSDFWDLNRLEDLLLGRIK